jgi:hypothetical protein
VVQEGLVNCPVHDHLSLGVNFTKSISSSPLDPHVSPRSNNSHDQTVKADLYPGLWLLPLSHEVSTLLLQRRSENDICLDANLLMHFF